MAGLVGVFRNGGGLGTGELHIRVMLFDPLLHRSSCFTDVDFAALAGNPVDHAILFSRIDGVLWSHQVWPKCRVGLEVGANEPLRRCLEQQGIRTLFKSDAIDTLVRLGATKGHRRSG